MACLVWTPWQLLGQLLFVVVVAPGPLWDFSSRTRDGSWALAVKVPNIQLPGNSKLLIRKSISLIKFNLISAQPCIKLPFFNSKHLSHFPTVVKCFLYF